MKGGSTSGKGGGAPRSSSRRIQRWSALGIKKVLLVTRNRFLTGLAISVPLIVTIWLLVLVYRSMVMVGRPVIDFLVKSTDWGLTKLGLVDEFHFEPPEYVLEIVAALLPIVVILGLGFMATNVLGKHVIRVVDGIMLRFPVVSYIYSGLKQAIDAFKGFGAGREFKRVVYVEYPAPGCRLIGFVTSQYNDRDLDAGVTSVFVPTAPNPMTGFVIVIEDEKVVDCDMTLEEATKMILSAGLVAPEEGSVSGNEQLELAIREQVKTPAAPVRKRDRKEEEEFAKWID